MKKFFDFLKNSPTALHTVDSIRKILLDGGYTEIKESDFSAFSDGKPHFTVRGGGSIIAFRTGGRSGFTVASAHSDAPSFKVKALAGQKGKYTRLFVEGYGGMIRYSWLDRPLSVAGRVAVRTEGGIDLRLVNIDKDLLVIPSVAIHLNRDVNEGVKLNPAVDLLPLIGGEGEDGVLLSLIAESLSVKEGDIISADLWLYNRECARTVGARGEYILSPRLDDLSCVYTALMGFLYADNSDSVSVLAVFDNEEVGSVSHSGADSDFLTATLRKIAGDESEYYRMIESSVMVSADVAHARHPNRPELSDPEWAPVLGSGIAIKHNANKRYATDVYTESLLKVIAERAGVPVVDFSSRADMPCGSTVGALSSSRASIPTVDVGIPLLSMHSSVETVAVADIEYGKALFKAVFSSTLLPTDTGVDIVTK